LLVLHVPLIRFTGIFTSKDVVLRVLAAGLDPSATKILAVMTPHPETVSRTTTVVEALRMMHSGRYLHLPVTGEEGVLEGLVDVLRLTYSTLDQLKGFKRRISFLVIECFPSLHQLLNLA